MSKIKTIFSAGEILLQHNVLSYRIDAYFPKYNLAIENDKQEHSTRDIDHEIKRQKAIEKELSCEFIRINPAKEKFDVFVEISKIQNFIVEANKKFLIDGLSNKLLRLEFK